MGRVARGAPFGRYRCRSGAAGGEVDVVGEDRLCGTRELQPAILDVLAGVLQGEAERDDRDATEHSEPGHGEHEDRDVLAIDDGGDDRRDRPNGAVLSGQTMLPPPARTQRIDTDVGSGVPMMRRTSSAWSALRKARAPSHR